MEVTARATAAVDRQSLVAAGVSGEAADVYLASDVVDLHVDSFIWHRIGGYDLRIRHGHGAFGARFYSQVDLPRLREAGVHGAIWVITTNPLRRGEGRRRAFRENARRLRALLSSPDAGAALVADVDEFREAKARGKHAAFLGIQGGNALDVAPEALDELPPEVVRVTLVHLSSSRLGPTSSPLATGPERLSRVGHDYVRALEDRNVLVDLAHIGRRAFFDVIAVHDRTKPIVVTHTGVAGVHDHWRNLTDEQLRAVAESGGTVGIMYHTPFLGPGLRRGPLSWVAKHVAHVVRTIGDDHVSLGSDWDGAIITPRDMPTCVELPRLVDALFAEGLSPETVRKTLGANFLRVLAMVRG